MNGDIYKTGREVMDEPVVVENSRVKFKTY